MSATVFPTGQINSIKDQLKLAIQLSKAQVVVTNPAVRHGTVLLQVVFSSLDFIRSVFWVA
jgi:hypothetical protein